ncbi:MAG: hypothetical protein LBK99_04190, partial [Opitutaceae bacterium]|nr:hypothetical protein [Opitutaceae bacterium]
PRRALTLCPTPCGNFCRKNFFHPPPPPLPPALLTRLRLRMEIPANIKKARAALGGDLAALFVTRSIASIVLR